MRILMVGYAVTAAAIFYGPPATFGQADDAPSKTDDAKAKATADEFSRLYSLADGEILKAIPDPKSGVRAAYYKDRPGLGVPQDSSGLLVYYRWRDGALVKNPNWRGGGGELRDLPAVFIDIQTHGVEGDAKLLGTKINADFLARDKVPAKDLVARLETILRRDFALPVKLTLAELERPCVVVRGRYKFTPAADQRAIEPEGRDRIEVRAGEIGDAPGQDLNAGGGFSALLSTLSDHTGHRFLDEVEAGPGKFFEWHITAYSNAVGVDDDRLDAILKNLAKDTGLTFERAKRRVRVLTVERAE